ncbi:T9SS type A sorting domain-containing protein [Crocinitomicaceae bacterium]|nr:T9SS type A sorting domain-containing protein [Crocinitomicaceae bacterium]
MKNSKSFLVTIFFLGVLLNLNAQYQPFLEPNKTWRELASNLIDDSWFIDEYKIENDTIINAVEYKKIELVWSNDVNMNTPIYVAAVREDTMMKKVFIVYGWDPTETERLLYDFDLNIGDQHTFDYCYTAQFPYPNTYNVDSMGIYTDDNGTNRKVWYLNWNDGDITYRIVEGVGSNTGLFSYSCSFTDSRHLVCVHKDSAVLYLNELPYANYCGPYAPYVGLQEYNIEEEAISLHPNPVNSFIKIKFPKISEFSKVNIVVIDQMGREFQLDYVKELNGIQIDVDKLNSGFYHLYIQTESRSYFKKFIKDKLEQ